jgi:hypothetical protein
MDQLKTYLEEKKYKVIDITSVITVYSYGIYSNLVKSKPNVIIYFKRNDKNNIIFEVCNASQNNNYYLLHKDNYMYINMHGDFTNLLKISINKFLNGESECGIWDVYRV